MPEVQTGQLRMYDDNNGRRAALARSRTRRRLCEARVSASQAGEFGHRSRKDFQSWMLDFTSRNGRRERWVRRSLTLDCRRLESVFQEGTYSESPLSFWERVRGVGGTSRGPFTPSFSAPEEEKEPRALCCD
jgi:hypothetical protein